MDKEIDIINIDGEEGQLLQDTFKRTYARFNGYALFDDFNAYVDRISKMNVKDDDIWVCSYPKTGGDEALLGNTSDYVTNFGTTWTQEMVYCVENDCDFKKAQKPLNDQYVFLDKCFLVPKKLLSHLQSDLDRIEKLLSNELTEPNQAQRFIHTHLPYELLPQKLKDKSTNAKIIYVVRNPRDTAISSFHFMLMLGRYSGSLKNYCKLFMKGLTNYAPFWKHVMSFWKKKNDKNLLFIKYEDMKKDLPSVIKKTTSFLGKNITDEQMDSLCIHLSFDSMKNNNFINEKPLVKMLKNNCNPQGNGEFFRKGESDQWKNDFDSELVNHFEQWEYENLKHLNITYFDL